MNGSACWHVVLGYNIFKSMMSDQAINISLAQSKSCFTIVCLTSDPCPPCYLHSCTFIMISYFHLTCSHQIQRCPFLNYPPLFKRPLYQNFNWKQFWWHNYILPSPDSWPLILSIYPLAAAQKPVTTLAAIPGKCILILVLLYCWGHLCIASYINTPRYCPRQRENNLQFVHSPKQLQISSWYCLS